MSTDKEDLAIDDEFQNAEEDAEPQPEVAKTNLNKRRTIDSLEERRLQKRWPISITTCNPGKQKPPDGGFCWFRPDRAAGPVR
jgi:hypothetical protein